MAEATTEKKTLIDALMPYIYKISEPLGRFGQIDFVKAISNGIAGSIGITLIGSLALVLFLFCSDGQLTETALLPFMKPYAGQIVLVQSLTLGIIAPYMVIAIGSEYAFLKGFSRTTGSVGAFLAFIMLNYNGISATAEGASALPIGNWGAGGIITAMLAVALSINIINLCYKRNIRIKLPESVPPAIADSFSAVIPYGLVALTCWFIRTILNFDIATWITTVLMPVLGAADNIFMFTFEQLLSALLWSVGLHGGSIPGAVISPFLTAWDLENATALISGTPVNELPHIWTTNLSFLCQWPASIFPLIILMVKDSKKVPQFKALSAIAIPPAIFSIIEPVLFGLPVMLNPFLFVPFVLSTTIAAFLTYAATAIGFVGRLGVALPWATPCPVVGFLGGAGSIGGLVWPFLMIGLGLLIYLPFWKVFVDDEVRKAKEREAELEEA